MKKQDHTPVEPREHRGVKRKLMAALCMLLISTILMATTSYAWLILSVAPEVTGIATNVAANGSLEIALLTTETRQNMDSISTGVGQSLAVAGNSAANNTWGNLVDLTFEQYGLNDIALQPARLQLVENSGAYAVDTSVLSVPTYGFDGRIVELTDNIISAVKGNEGFSLKLGTQDYGVRAFGTSNTLTAQASALAMAKANIKSYTQSAKNSAVSALSSNGNDLLGLLIKHSANSSATYNDADLAVVNKILSDLKQSVSYIDSAMRQGILAVAASEIADESLFNVLRDRVNSGAALSTLLEDVEGMPAEFTSWITELESTQNELNLAANLIAEMNDGDYSWEEIKEALSPLMNLGYIYIGDTLFNNMSAAELSGLVGGDINMTIAPGGGVLANIADFTGNYSAVFSAMGSNVSVETASKVDAHLLVLHEGVLDLEAADGGAEGSEVELSTTYGYGLDLAFRTNAAASNLLLQTAGVQRVYSDSTAADTMGGGSYMEFATDDEFFTLTQMVQLMDAIRVGFVDDQNNVLGIGKLNTSNRVIVDGTVSAPLYLYDFEISAEEETLGALVMGERKKDDNAITELQQGVAKAVTVVVWLDGDTVDNSMVSATGDVSMSGTLNLQFASSADLVPANNGDLKNATADVTALSALVEEYADEYENGQQTYTTSSWRDFAAAYLHAQTLVDSAASSSQVYWASYNLLEAATALEEADLDALKATIAEYRTMMGQTTDPARYVVSVDGEIKAIDPYTEELYDQKIATIYRVDYTNNLKDEGNGVMVPIYTDASWSSLAAALYEAETLVEYDKPFTIEEIDDAITSLENAEAALVRKILYAPYDYQGSLYYFAVANPLDGEAETTDTDTYGKWYDSSFNRVTSDLMILKLDADAEATDIAELLQPAYVKYNESSLAPVVSLLDDKYSVLKDDKIVGVNWSMSNENFVQIRSARQKAELEALLADANALDRAGYPVGSALITAAQAIVDYEYTGYSENMPTYDTIETAIAALAAAVKVAKEEKVKAETPAADPETDRMTFDQHTVLQLAVANAKTIKGYDDTVMDGYTPEQKAELTALRNDVKAAEDLLELFSDMMSNIDVTVTVQMANDALDKVNAHLVTAGMKEVTERNSIWHSVPVGSEIFDVAYTANAETGYLCKIENANGEGLLQAVIMTKNGVISTVKKNVTFYAPADDAMIVEEAGAEWDGVMTAGSKMNIWAELLFTSYDAELLKTLTKEEIKECEWSSDDTEVLTVTGGGAEAELTAKAAGTAMLRVTITTKAGTVIPASVVVTVS